MSVGFLKYAEAYHWICDIFKNYLKTMTLESRRFKEIFDLRC